MKVAIVHYWLVSMRGGEAFINTLLDLFPDADIYTHVYDKHAVSDKIAGRKISTTFIQNLPLSKHLYQSYLPFMPLALEQIDLRSYDLVISSESGPAKGVLTPLDCLHVCYCHTPMRYLWDMYHDYKNISGPLKRIAMIPLFHYLRLWDTASAQRVDRFVANSKHVANRIKKIYRRNATVIHPPVDVQDFFVSEELDDFYLMVGQLVGYKRVDLAIRAFNRMQKPLIVIGEGEQYGMLNQIAGPNIKLMGRQPFSVVQEHYAKCQALIFPGEEDFGIVPVEAMASGRPVIAYGRGGALETVVEGETGIFFFKQSEEALIDAVNEFESNKNRFKPIVCRNRAKIFNIKRFQKEFLQFVELNLN